MSALLQVIGRELRVRALMPVTGAATAVGILLTAWLVNDGKRFKELAETSVFFAGFFLVAGALLVGAVALARDLEGNRSLFWLARPIGAWTAFSGKLISSFLLVVATALLTALPAILVDPGLLEEPLVFAGAVGFTIGCIALGASLGLLLRNRSAWFIAAVAILIGFGAGMWINIEPFMLARAGGIGELLVNVGVGALIVGLLAAHGVAFAHGRYDARAQARRFTLVLFIVLGGTLAASWAFGSWLRGLGPGDFDLVHERAGSGNALVVDGWRERPVSWARSFAVDLERGTAVPLPPGTWDVAPSPHRIFYAAPIALQRSTFEIFAVDFGAAPRTRKTGIVLTQQIGGLATPADGSRVAVTGPDGTQVYDVAGRSLGSFKRAVKDDAAWRTGWVRAIFVSPDRLRLYEFSEGRILIREADLRTRTIRDLGSLPGRAYGFAPASERLVVSTDPTSRRRDAMASLAVHDAQSGVKLFEFPAGTRTAVPLSDGSWAALLHTGAGERIVHVDAAGNVLSEAAIPPGAKRFLGEIRPGIVGLTESVGKNQKPQQNLLLLDLGSGRIVKRIPDVKYARGHGSGRVYATPGSPELRVLTVGGDLHEIDPKTLEAKKRALK